MKTGNSRSMGNPPVSIIMTVFNGEDFVKNGIQALLNQTYQNLEVIVVDDGSTDNTVKEVGSISDNRLILLKRDRQGRGHSLNDGIKKAKGKYIAINDADDISLPNRIQKEVDFLEAHPDVGMVGSYHYNRRADSKETLTTYPTDDHELRLALTRGQPFAHQTIMYRREVLDQVGGYSETVPFMFDREIFIRIAAVTRVANIPDPLVIVRHHPSRFFYHRFTGRRRGLMHQKMRMKAARVLGFPFHRRIAPFAGYLKEFLQLDPIFRLIIPDRAREKMWNWIYGVGLPGRKTHGVNKPNFRK